MEIQTIPQQLTYVSVAKLRMEAEKGCDPDLYEMAASGFDALDMPAASIAMRRRAEHYRSLKIAEYHE